MKEHLKIACADIARMLQNKHTNDQFDRLPFDKKFDTTEKHFGTQGQMLLFIGHWRDVECHLWIDGEILECEILANGLTHRLTFVTEDVQMCHRMIFNAVKDMQRKVESTS